MIDEWQEAGLWPQRTAHIIAPSRWSGGSTEIVKTDDEWRSELQAVYGAGARGVAVFDLGSLQRNPSKIDVLGEFWR